jgi:Immunoglobulin-like domain of bacterial spore germination
VRRLLPFLALTLVAAGCGGGGTTTVTVTTTHVVTRTVTTQVTPQTVRLYFFRNGKLGPVSRQVTSTSRDALLAALNDGPTEEEKRLGFEAAQGDGQTAEIVYTLSQFDPSKPVVVGGKRYTRGDFEDVTPAILVETPLPFDEVSAPLRVAGTANTFEATFDYELLDPAGKVLAHDFVTATSGSGTRGTYDFKIPFEAPNGVGKLVVYEQSAADGSRIHQVEIPLSLAK